MLLWYCRIRKVGYGSWSCPRSWLVQSTPSEARSFVASLVLVDSERFLVGISRELCRSVVVSNDAGAGLEPS